jgi:hypothetical protein
MGDNEQFDDETVSTGLSHAEVREMARRQLAASVAVAAVIAIGVGLVALAPASRDIARDMAMVASHKVATVQQPQFATPVNARLEPTKRIERELP